MPTNTEHAEALEARTAKARKAFRIAFLAAEKTNEALAEARKELTMCETAELAFYKHAFAPEA